MLSASLIFTACSQILLAVQGLDRLAEYDYVAIFDADFKPDADFLVSLSLDYACLLLLGCEPHTVVL